ncbi:MAG TPA: YhgE/Pip domain-containing protein, partial [Bacillota bacterium]|nr:YhgE/Pip domain-containing protein [Bacillota bacterium]
ENMPFELDEIANEMVEYLDEIADELENNLALLDELEQMDELIDGLQTLATEYDQFHQGVIEYTNGVDDLTKAYGDIDQGINDISEGTTELKDGVKELKDGTEELRDETKDLPNEMQSEIDQFMEDFDFSKFKPKSFISKKNKKIGVVQFVLQTETIEIPEDDTEEIIEEESKNLWQRFLDLFR